MLSILIPVYNTDCTQLVKQLQAEARSLRVPYEIIVADDASRPDIGETNRQITEWGCRYLPLPENIGPARIRNYLAEQAKYPSLLFMDADTLPASGHFLQDYLQAFRPNTVVCGGFLYHRQKPQPDYALRYYYGIQVEEKNAAQRGLHPYTQFIGMSFLADKQLFSKVRFDETMHFGYEDAWFGIRLKQAGIPIRHIDNPVYHLSADTSAAYLEKIRRSVDNLSNHIDKMRPYIRLLQWHTKIEKLHLKGTIASLFKRIRPLLEKNLTSASPSLHLFAFYKLGYLCLIRQGGQ